MNYTNGLLRFHAEDRKIQLLSFMGYTVEELETYGFSTSTHEELYELKDDNTLSYAPEYLRQQEQVPFIMSDDIEDLTLYYDPYRSKLSITIPRYSFTFYDGAVDLFHDITDISDHIENFAADLIEPDVKNFFIRVEPAANGCFKISIQRQLYGPVEYEKETPVKNIKNLLQNVKEAVSSLLDRFRHKDTELIEEYD